MLISPNLRTLYDKKKPPPPYPGPKTEEFKMDTGDQEMVHHEEIHQQEAPTQSNSSSVVRYCSPQAYKFFMEQHAENILKHHKAREFRSFQLENEMTKVDLPPSLKDQMRKLLRQKETNYLRLRRAKMNKSMFEHIKVLGLGAFGEVNLVRKRDDMQRLYAMKILHKSDVFNRNQAAHVKAERDILAEADNEWVVKLYYSFQDDENLYFVMDYVPGGDLMNLLIKLQVFSEELSKFYIGELTCAIESVHNLGFIHRDIKPDNILIDKSGHIKLTDFGLCTGFHWTHNSKHYQIDDSYNRLLDQKMSNTATANGKANSRRLMAHSLVGTPNYIAPEILSRKGYTKSCDWWSVGVILFEMLVGEPPFRDETALGTQGKVINWKQTLKIPAECNLSAEASDLIYKLCIDAENRLGSNGIKSHSFFEGFDFGPNLRMMEAPYIPPLKHPTDTSNFEPIDYSVLADRKARLNDMSRNNSQPTQANRFSPYNMQRGNEDHHNEYKSSNNYSNNPMLYEFTFRRFFDEAYSSDNLLRYNDTDSNSFSNFIKSVSKENQKKEETMSPSLTPLNTNSAPGIYEETNLSKSKNPLSIKPSNNIQMQQQQPGVNKINSSSSTNDVDLKENRIDDNQTPIFV